MGIFQEKQLRHIYFASPPSGSQHMSVFILKNIADQGTKRKVTKVDSLKYPETTWMYIQTLNNWKTNSCMIGVPYFYWRKANTFQYGVLSFQSGFIHFKLWTLFNWLKACIFLLLFRRLRNKCDVSYCCKWSNFFIACYFALDKIGDAKKDYCGWNTCVEFKFLSVY